MAKTKAGQEALAKFGERYKKVIQIAERARQVAPPVGGEVGASFTDINQEKLKILTGEGQDDFSYLDDLSDEELLAIARGEKE